MAGKRHAGSMGRTPKAARPAGEAAPPDVTGLLRDLLAQTAPDEHKRSEGEDVILLDRSLWDLEERYRRLAQKAQEVSPPASALADEEARRSRRASRRVARRRPEAR